MATLVAKMDVPFVDLKQQYASIKLEVLEAMNGVLDSAHYVGGEHVERFEYEFAGFVGAKHAVGLSSGTAALELALKVADIAYGDEVIVPANSFFATAEAVSNVGAVPVFADIDASTFHLNVSSVERCITPRTRAVIPVHLYGLAMDLSRLDDLCTRYGLKMIEDAAQAHGVGHGRTRVGGSGRLTCFSFYPGKNLGAYGDAGAVTCGDDKLAGKLRLLRDHGSPAKYEHSIVGTNSRLDALQAAVLSVKLRHLEHWNGLRAQHAAKYCALFKDSDVCAPAVPVPGTHNFHLFVVRIADRDRVKKRLQQEFGIQTGIHYPVPLHQTGAYQNSAQRGESLQNSEMISRQILSLPMFPELGGEQLAYVAASLLEVAPPFHAQDAPDPRAD